MKKIELIWRHLLFATIEERATRFEQQALAKRFGMSSSTVNLALSPLRRLGAIQVGGRGFEVVDFEKILYHWANHRSLADDVAYALRVDLPMFEIEGLLPDGTIPTAYTAVRERYGEAPASYDHVYCYHSTPNRVRKRFSDKTIRGQPNVFVLQADALLGTYGAALPLGQLFVDLWNMTDWYAKDFVRRVKEDIDGLLS